MNNYSFSFEGLEEDLLILVDKYYLELIKDGLVSSEESLLFDSFKLELMEFFFKKNFFLNVVFEKKSYNNSEFINIVYFSYFPSRLFLFILIIFLCIFKILSN